MSTRLAVFCVVLIAIVAGPAAGDFAEHVVSFGEGVPHVKWLALAPDEQSVVLSDDGLVRSYTLDGQPLERLYYRQPAGQHVAVAAAADGSIYLLSLRRFDDNQEDVPVIVRRGADGSALAWMAGKGDGPGEFQYPRNLAVAPEGTVFVSDYGNGRIQKLSADLEFLAAWPTPESVVAGGLSGPCALAVDHSNRIWACYIDESAWTVDYPIEVVIYDTGGQQVGGFAAEIRIEHAGHHWGDVVKDMGVDASGELHVLAATQWSARHLVTFDESGSRIASFATLSDATNASFDGDGSAIVSRGNVGGIEVVGPTGELLHSWGTVDWAAERDLPTAPQDIAFDAGGNVLVSGGDLASTYDPRCYGFVHRYTQEGDLDEVVLSTRELCWDYWYFAVAPDGAVLPSYRPVVSDEAGNLYYLIQDYSPGGMDLVRKTDLDGTTLEEWELGRNARGIAVGHDGLFYATCDSEVQVRDLDGNLLRAWRPFSVSAGIAADAAGRVYVGRALYSREGEFLGTLGHVDGVPVFPSALALSEDGKLAIADEWWSRIHIFQVISSRFQDVPWHFWALDAIEAAADSGIVQGYPGGRYYPDISVSRDQMAVYISRALAGGDAQVPEGSAASSFADVPTEDWAYKYVEYATAAGVVSGYPDGLYHPADVVHRAQMAVFIARAVAGSDGAIPAPPLFPTFPDVTNNGRWNWCYKHVEYLAAQGIVWGYPDGLYHPGNWISRAQMAVYVARAFQAPQ